MTASTNDRREVLADEHLARMLRQVESVAPEAFRHAWSLSAGDVALALRELMEHRAALAAQEPRPWAGCTGAGDCPEAWHEHGCYADRGQCSDPSDHRGYPAQEGERGGAEVAAVEAVLEATEWYCDDDHDWGGRARLTERLRAALADPAGALAKHDAEDGNDERVWITGADGKRVGWGFDGERADRIAGDQPTEVHHG